MKCLRIIIWFFLSIAAPLFARAATSGFIFHPLNAQMPSDEVASLYQDHDGFIWIVTYGGLVRYDGYNSIAWPVKGENEEPIDGYLHVVLEDNHHCLYIGTERGLMTLDKNTGLISRIHDPIVDHINVTDLVKDSLGRIWISSDKGVFRKDSDKDEFIKIDLSTAKKPLTDVIDLLLDDNGNLWITSWNTGLFKYVLQEGKLYSYTSGDLSEAYVLHQDRKGNLWVGTWGRGLLRVGRDAIINGTLSYTTFSHDQHRSSSLMDNIIYDIDEDPSGRIWIGSRSGLSIYDPSSGTDSFMNIYPDRGYGLLPYNEVNSILRTGDDTMWLGMLGGGVCKVEDGSENISAISLSKVQNEYKTSSVRSIFRENGDTFWLGIAGHGMICYDSKTGNFQNYADMPAFAGFLSTSTVDDIIASPDSSKIYFGSYSGGLWIYDMAGESAQVISSTTAEKMDEDCIHSLAADHDGNIWIGTRNGVFIKEKSDSVVPLASWLGLESPNPGYKVLDMSVDKNGDVWMATNYDGVIRVSSQDRKIYEYLPEDNLESKAYNSIFCDSEGRVWAGSMWNGLYRWNPQSGKLEKVSGFVFLDGSGVNNIAEDPHGRIWVTTNSSAVSFMTGKDDIFNSICYWNISGRQGFGFFNRNASLYMRDTDEMAFGTSKGIVLLPCLQPESSAAKFDISFTDLFVNKISFRNGNPLRDEKKNVFRTDINYIDKITLDRHHNDISISFSLFDFKNPSGDIYHYRLRKSSGSGNEVWMIVNGNRNVADFYGLKPGKYVFEVYGTRSGSMNSSGIKTLGIKILPNPWLTWWAIALYILAFGAALSLAIAMIHARLSLRRKMIIDQVNQQKADEVNQAKLRFFTNVSHEFLTPLSIILASIESLVPKTEKEKNVIQIMTTNAIRLTRLVQQVLEFRKVETDNLKIKVSKNDAAEFIGQCVEAFIPLIRKHDLTISYSSDPTSIIGWFDPDKMDKIIYNLISNAVKYTPTHGNISIMARLIEGDKLRVSCTNGGKLMTPKTISGLFRRFYEGDYRNFNTIGTGIGLSLVKSLVSIHKGTINVESNEAVGNRFTFTIPIGRDAYAADEIDDAPEEKVNIPLALTINEPAIKCDDHTVLCVDDNDDITELFTVIMSKRFNVLTCKSGEEAIEILGSKNVDVVVADVMMPGMSGLELCSYIKEHVEFSHIPVILLTAKKDDLSSIEGYKHGADGYLAKPCNYFVLSAMIMNLIKKQENKSADFRKQLVFEVKDIDYTSTDKKLMS
jgi:ligand-binding sensor domain-containing protein/signal transduction histidine kinase/CheY-like chemotaxis protein